ncbi:MAG TPA: efflux RND transporter periplasmic adaptor subunit [Nevskiales bacterium]|nr:efflux RND transporter periplasmic adaptor subunit [Nevskiales bacterium]
MNRKHIPIAAVVLLISVAAGSWLARQHDGRPASRAGHQHLLLPRTDAQGKVYYSCPMHPQVRQDEPGNCPICGMKLVKREQAVASPSPGPSPQGGGEKTILYWYDPMKPEVHFDKPGKSPFMDMELVPKYAETAGAGVVEIDPRMAQNLGMRTAAVRRGTFWQRIDATGAVAIDERRIVAVEARTAGWIERLAVRAIGDPVRRGQVVAGVYSPELFATQQELALAQKLGDPALVEAARTRLRLLGGGDRDAASPQPRVAIHAPQAGVVTELRVREGAQVTPGMPLMMLADLSRVWIVVAVPEAQAGWVATGKPAEARLRALPGRVFEGRVDYVYPLLDAETRTLRLRLVFDNPDGALKPGMYAEATVFGGARREVTLVPTEAVIRSGERSMVIVAEAAGRYRPVEVRIGAERAGESEVLEGLVPGQQVVVSGQFLIDSEASLVGAYRRLAPPSDALPLGAGARNAVPSTHEGDDTPKEALSPPAGEGQGGGAGQ